VQEVVMEDNRFIAEVRTQLRESIGDERYGLWFGDHTKLLFEQDRLTVLAANAFSCDWLRRHFTRQLRQCCSAVIHREIRVEFDVDAELGESEKLGKVARPEKAPCRDAADDSHRAETTCGAKDRRPALLNNRPDNLRRQGEPTLSSLVVGKCNEYAFTASELVARGLQQASPILLHGPTGVGKTHLLRAVRAERRRCQPRARAVYLTAEQFTSGFVEALRGSGLPSFRQKCRGADLFLIDDLQFFAGKRASLDELLHTLDTLQGEGRQTVLAADRSLGELHSLGKEMVSRLAGGLTCAIDRPDFATRLEIVRRLSGELRLAISDDVATLVATEITSTARELRGALYRLQAVSMSARQTISRELASRTLDELAQQCTAVVRLTDVEQAVCKVFGVERTELRSDRKNRSIQEPRMLAMWLARKYTRAPWSEIGQYFGRRSHSTVISAHRRVEELIRSHGQIGLEQQNRDVEEVIRRVENALRTA
jgi:chromosomal replication initiator protein